MPGEARVDADVLEASRYSLTMQVADDQSPTVGEIRGQAQGTFANLLGFGDLLTANYGRSDALNDGFIEYSLPIASDDTRIGVRYDRNGTVVVTPALVPLNITSTYSSVGIGLSRPFYRTAEQNLTLGISLERRQEQTFLLGMPFDFVPGSVNGETNVTALRFTQSWLDRNAERAFAFRSTLSFGLQALGATVTDMPPTGQFFVWLGQAQYVRRIFRDWEFLVRSDLQISDRPLFQIEQFALGGIDTVRGYREYLTVTDDAALVSAELHIPIIKLRIPRLADSEDAGQLQLVPFYDFGRGWNVDRPNPLSAEHLGRRRGGALADRLGAHGRILLRQGAAQRRCRQFAGGPRHLFPGDQQAVLSAIGRRGRRRPLRRARPRARAWRAPGAGQPAPPRPRPRPRRTIGPPARRARLGAPVWSRRAPRRQPDRAGSAATRRWPRCRAHGSAGRGSPTPTRCRRCRVRAGRGIGRRSRR